MNFDKNDSLQTHIDSHSLTMILIMFTRLIFLALTLTFFYINYPSSRIKAQVSLARLRYSYFEKYNIPSKDEIYGV